MAGTASELGAEDAHGQHCRELERAERVRAAAREEDERCELDRRDPGQRRDERHGVRAHPADERECDQDDAEEDERERTEPERERRGAGCQPPAVALQEPERAQAGGKAQRIAVRPHEDRPGREHGERARRPVARRSPLPFDDRGEERRGHDDGGEHERHVPDESGRKVVEEAVGGERVVAAVPEVVPDVHALLDQERPVEMRRRVAGRGRERDEKRGAREGEAARDQDLAPRRDQAGDGGGHRVSVTVRLVRLAPVRRLLLIALFALLLVGCGGGDETTATAETVDTTATQTDTGETGTGETETGETETGETETGGDNEAVEGDPAAGEQVYASNGCGSCHTFEPAGSSGTTGPDLDELPDLAENANQPLADFTRTAITTRPPTSKRASRKASCPRTTSSASKS